MKHAVAYARVSSKEQEKEGFSIPAQQKLLREYAAKSDIQIAREFADSETAKSAGREQYGQMLRFLKESKTVKTILVEKTDRLYRNFRDYVDLDDLDVEIHLVKEGEVLSQDSRSHQKFIHGIKVLMAKNYIDNLSEEVKKGLYEKAAAGQYPGQAPTGYLNDKERHVMTVDPERAPLVRALFEHYATGQETLDTCWQWAKANGLWSKYGKPLSRGNIERILKNPVYYGDFVYGGRYYRGTHEPVVSRELFDQVQAAFQRRTIIKSARKDDWMFSGLLKCAECGCAVVAEMKKGRYVYYHCSGYRKDCGSRSNYVREEVLARQFAKIMQRIHLTQETIDECLAALKDSFRDKNAFRDEQIASLTQKIATTRRRLDQAYLDKLDGKISEGFWKERSAKWHTEMTAMETQLVAFTAADKPYYDRGKRILELCKHASEFYLRATKLEKREMLNIVKSNFQLRGATIEYELKSPFDLAVKWASRPALLPELDAFRTLILSPQSDYLLEIAERLAA